MSFEKFPKYQTEVPDSPETLAMLAKINADPTIPVGVDKSEGLPAEMRPGKLRHPAIHDPRPLVDVNVEAATVSPETVYPKPPQPTIE